MTDHTNNHNLPWFLESLCDNQWDKNNHLKRSKNCMLKKRSCNTQLTSLEINIYFTLAPSKIKAFRLFLAATSRITLPISIDPVKVSCKSRANEINKWSVLEPYSIVSEVWNIYR